MNIFSVCSRDRVLSFMNELLLLLSLNGGRKYKVLCVYKEKERMIYSLSMKS